MNIRFKLKELRIVATITSTNRVDYTIRITRKLDTEKLSTKQWSHTFHVGKTIIALLRYYGYIETVLNFIVSLIS